MTGPDRQYPRSSREVRSVSGPGIGWPVDVVELILADHRRIGRLRDVLYDSGRHDGSIGPDWTPGHVWRRLAALLVTHTRAEEEICYLPMLGSRPRASERLRDSMADHADIREVIGEASLQPAGSASWWRAVRTVVAISTEHFEREERDLLPDGLLGATMAQRKELGRQWCAFIAAWREDATPGSG
jgi:Hemerythrin HHE cation binding domain